MNKHLEAAIRAAKAGGEVLMSHYGKTKTELKDPGVYDVGSVVTVADRESEARITDVLSNSFPEYGIYGEEGASHNTDADFLWVIDPLDGTSNFIRNIPLFGISIGLLEKGVPVAGVLFFPALNLLAHAAKGEGAFANNAPIKVSDRPLEHSLYYAGGVFKKRIQLSIKLAEAAGFVEIINASSFEFAKIAMGDAEIYYLENVLHDVAAGICIVQEAGGKVTDENGHPWSRDVKYILATNGVAHDQALGLIK